MFREIAQAHREIYALYEIAQSMGTGLGVSDTMTLIASKLRNVVPFSACALFLHDTTTATFGCRFATGVDAELLRQIVIRDERGVIGWVGANRRPLVNARPSADLEAAGIDAMTTLRSALACPLIVRTASWARWRCTSRCRGRSPTITARLLDRVYGAGRRRREQRGRLRPDPARCADRSADGPAERAVHVRAPHARAGARGTARVRSVRGRGRSRRVQADRRQFGHRPAIGPCARWGASCAPPSARTTAACATRATSS